MKCQIKKKDFFQILWPSYNILSLQKLEKYLGEKIGAQKCKHGAP